MPAWSEVRRTIPAADRWVYFDNAATSPVPYPVMDAVRASMEQRAWDGEGFFDAACARADDVRRRIAAHLGTAPEGIAFMKNTGEGINHAARSLPFAPGANVVTTSLEFPSNMMPWRALEREKKVELRVVEPDDRGMGVTPEAIAAAVDDDTALVAVSWVAYANGYRHDVAAMGQIAHERGALMLVDGIQGLGAAPVPDMRHVDLFACGGHKWLMAPFGIGFLHIRPELARSWAPDHLGWWSLSPEADFEDPDGALAPSARRFEIGNLAFDLIDGLGAAFDLLPPDGAHTKRIAAMTRRLMEGLAPLGRLETPEDDAHRAGIVRLAVDAPQETIARLERAGVRSSLRRGAVRFSPHHWATEDEVERVIACVRAARA